MPEPFVQFTRQRLARDLASLREAAEAGMRKAHRRYLLSVTAAWLVTAVSMLLLIAILVVGISRA